jgi:hypothetical protein
VLSGVFVRVDIGSVQRLDDPGERYAMWLPATQGQSRITLGMRYEPVAISLSVQQQCSFASCTLVVISLVGFAICSHSLPR